MAETLFRSQVAPDCNVAFLAFWLMVPTYSPFTSYLGFVAYSPGLKGVSAWFNMAQRKSVFLGKRPVTVPLECVGLLRVKGCVHVCVHMGKGRGRGKQWKSWGGILFYLYLTFGGVMALFLFSLAPRQRPHRLCLATPLQHPSHRSPDMQARPDLPGGPGSTENLGCHLHLGLNRK